MKLKIRPTHSDWDNLNGLFFDNNETIKENNIVMISLFVIAIAIILVVFIIGISLC